MSDFIVYVASDRNLSAAALQRAAQDLALEPASASAGVGLGWMQENRSLLRSYPRPAAQMPDVLDLLADLPSRVLLATQRRSTQKPVGALDLAPFRFRRWLWASTDVTFVADELPDYIRQNVHGRSGSEQLFHAVLSALHRSDLVDDPALTLEQMALTLRDVAQAAQTSCALATQNRAVVFAGQRPVYFLPFEGFEHTPAAAFAGHKPRAVSHPAFRATFVTTSPPTAEGWATLKEGEVLVCDTHGARRV